MNTKSSFPLPVHSLGRRLTRQRQLVWEILQQHQGHLEAETLYLQAKTRDAHISLATVYRALAYLKSLGLVQVHSLGENHGHFEATPAAPHDHFTCLKCGRVVELSLQTAHEELIKECQSQGLQIVTVNLHLSGYCLQCQATVAEAGER